MNSEEYRIILENGKYLGTFTSPMILKPKGIIHFEGIHAKIISVSGPMVMVKIKGTSVVLTEVKPRGEG